MSPDGEKINKRTRGGGKEEGKKEGKIQELKDLRHSRHNVEC
jgi:hypothetical protein